jgi:hypothetical protein
VVDFQRQAFLRATSRLGWLSSQVRPPPKRGQPITTHVSTYPSSHNACSASMPCTQEDPAQIALASLAPHARTVTYHPSSIDTPSFRRASPFRNVRIRQLPRHLGRRTLVCVTIRAFSRQHRPTRPDDQTHVNAASALALGIMLNLPNALLCWTYIGVVDPVCIL